MVSTTKDIDIENIRYNKTVLFHVLTNQSQLTKEVVLLPLGLSTSIYSLFLPTSTTELGLTITKLTIKINR